MTEEIAFTISRALIASSKVSEHHTVPVLAFEPHHEKLIFCIHEIKGVDQLRSKCEADFRSKCEADQCLCFRYP